MKLSGLGKRSAGTWCVHLLGVLAVVSSVATFAQGQGPQTQTKRLDIAPGAFVMYPEAWVPPPQQRYKNAVELLRIPTDQRGTPTEALAPRIMIITENRLSHDEAVRRLKEIDAEYPGYPAAFNEIAGWPALQRRYVVPMERRGPRFQDPDGAEMSIRHTTAIAADNKLIRIEGVLQPGTLASYANEIAVIGQSAVLPARGEPADVQRRIENLRNTPRLIPVEVQRAIEGAQPQQEQGRRGGDGGAQARPPGQVESQSAVAGTPTLAPILRVQTAGAGSEIEVAVSDDGLNIVVVSNGRNFATSNDGGLTFPFTGLAGTGGNTGANGDPSVAYGATGNFYFAYIGFPTAPSCSTAMTRSTDNGQTFPFLANATVCTEGAGTSCFPDQHHIAADRWNLSASNEDQVYSAWRDFSGGGCGGAGNTAIAGPEIPSLICSSDSGVNWTAKLAIDAAGANYSRITVGSDGFVYVVYRSGGNVMVHKFSSCDNGLNAQVGFPVNVASVFGVECPIAGLDRCNNGNNLSSHTLAVDDTDPTHIYLAYANSLTGAAGAFDEEVFVRHSTDGGLTWSGETPINRNEVGRRWMPWVCSTRGNAYVTWFETVQFSDTTDFYCGGATVDGNGDLVWTGEVRITPVSDNLCDSGWPCAPRAATDSEACPTQPQLAGVCTTAAGTATATRCDFSDCGGANMGVGAGCQCNIASGQTCNLGGGCPRYGDYNGNACMLGNLYSSWGSATSYPGITPASTSVNAFFAMKVVVNEPPVAVCQDFSDVADANCCIMVDVADIDDGSFDPNGPADIASLCIVEVDGLPAGCVQTVQVCGEGDHVVTLGIEDLTGETDSCNATVTVQDNTPISVSIDITNSEPILLDDNCEATVDFTAVIHDNCCIDEPNIVFTINGQGISVDSLDPGTPVASDAGRTLTYNGTFRAFDLTVCPATVEIQVEAEDCAGNGEQSESDSAELRDDIPPTITFCPPDVTFARGDKICNDEVQDWLDSFMAEDNCASIGASGTEYSAAGLGLAIPDNNSTGVSHTITVPNSFTVSDLRVGLDVTHTFVGDLCVSLSHGGTTVTLIDRMGANTGAECHQGGPFGCGQDNFDIVLSDSGAGGPIEALCAITMTSPPDYVPNNPLSAFDGMDAQGDWTITVADNAGEDIGTLNAWSLVFSSGSGCDLTLTNDAPECGFAFGTTTTVTFTAEDCCGNTTSCSADITIDPAPRVDASVKGSLLAFSKVDLRWTDNGAGGINLVQDTILTLTNDEANDVWVKLYFVNGDAPLDAIEAGSPPVQIAEAEPGWNWVNCMVPLTKDQPLFWSAWTGGPLDCQPFTALDGGSPAGRPDPENPGGRVLRGFVYAFAVNDAGHEIRWNHLSGHATIVDYSRTAAWEYNAFAFQNRCVEQGEELLDCTLFDDQGVCCEAEAIPGQLDMDAFQLDFAYDQLLLNFFASGSTAMSRPGVSVQIDTDLTLYPLSQDLRQDSLGPVTTKAKFDIWNQNEAGRSGTTRCISCWDQTLLSQYTTGGIANNFRLPKLSTDKGKARIDGIASTVCDRDVRCVAAREDHAGQMQTAGLPVMSEEEFQALCSQPAALLGVSAKLLSFQPGGAPQIDYAGSPLVGSGRESGIILFDIVAPPGEAQAPGNEALHEDARLKQEEIKSRRANPLLRRGAGKSGGR